MNGIVNFYKPKAMTSHDAVNYFRRLLNIKRIGHSGTLDPNVTGVLPICIGKATRVSEYLLEADKEYIGELTLGIATDSQDGDGLIVKQSNKRVNEDEILKVFNSYIGSLDQIPPMYSAVKVGGRKLYDLAREGKTIQRDSRKIEIYDLKILDIWNNQKVKFYVRCSKGTYIRTLCNDIGERLGTYGYMSHLIRVGVGNFNIKDSLSMDYLNSLDNTSIEKILFPIDYALDSFDQLVLEDSLYGKLTNGLMVSIDTNHGEESLIKVYCKNKFIGIAEIRIRDGKRYLKMKKVFV